MRSSLLKYCILLAAFLSVFPLRAAGKGGDDIFLESSLEKEKAVEGERLIYEVRLFSADPEIAGTELLANPDMGELPFKRSAADSRLSETVRDGRRYYTAVIDRFFIGANEPGKHTIKGGTYNVGLNHRVRVDDPFWGSAYSNRIEAKRLKAPDVALKVAALPERNRPEDFSGAVGKYTIQTWLPEGEIRAGENATMIVTVEGKGDLTDTPAPDVRQAFREGFTFRSMTDEKEHFISKGSLGSEMTLECIFTPDAPGEHTILPIRFTYFDSDSGKYVTVETEPVTLTVKPAKETRDGPPVFHNI